MQSVMDEKVTLKARSVPNVSSDPLSMIYRSKAQMIGENCCQMTVVTDFSIYIKCSRPVISYLTSWKQEGWMFYKRLIRNLWIDRICRNHDGIAES